MKTEKLDENGAKELRLVCGSILSYPKGLSKAAVRHERAGFSVARGILNPQALLEARKRPQMWLN